MPHTSGEPTVGPRATLWRTCRALADTRRLEIIRELLHHSERCVSAVAVRTHLSRSMATRHLRCLAARGLLRARRDGAWVYYSLAPDPSIPEAGPLVAGLRQAFEGDSRPVPHIYGLVTAFTHPRRQAVYEVLQDAERTFADLRDATGMSSRALRRHLDKLRRRGFVVFGSGRYAAATPPGRLARLLAELAPRAPR